MDPEEPSLEQVLTGIDHARSGVAMQVIEPLYAMSLRALPGAGAPWTQALCECGVARLPAPGHLEGESMLVMWISPTEHLIVTQHPTLLAPLQRALQPGSVALACAVDRSAGVVGIELTGPALDPLLARLVDSSAVAASAGRATRARCIDLAVVLMRLSAGRAWMLVDRPVAGTLAQWLRYAACALAAR